MQFNLLYTLVRMGFLDSELQLVKQDQNTLIEQSP